MSASIISRSFDLGFSVSWFCSIKLPMVHGNAQESMAGQGARAQFIAAGADEVAVRQRRQGGQMIEKSASGHSISTRAAPADAATVCNTGHPSNVPPTAAKRRQMAKVKTQNTAPEIAVRRAMHAGGLRFRLHRQDLPGRPDIVLSRHRTAVFVHGCYWHGCVMCDRGVRRPRTNVGFWSAKLDENRRRDDMSNSASVSAGFPRTAPPAGA